jgi:hypothetical protein
MGIFHVTVCPPRRAGMSKSGRRTTEFGSMVGEICRTIPPKHKKFGRGALGVLSPAKGPPASFLFVKENHHGDTGATSDLNFRNSRYHFLVR